MKFTPMKKKGGTKGFSHAERGWGTTGFHPLKNKGGGGGRKMP